MNGPHKASVFRLCTIVTFVVAAALTFSSVFSVWRFTAHDVSNWDMDHTVLWPALTYFDQNRDAPAVLDIQTIPEPTTGDLICTQNGGMDKDHGSYTAGTAKVANTAWTPVTSLGQWRGTVDGCEQNVDITKITVGKCTGNSDTTGKPVNKVAAITLNRWRDNKFFCVLHTIGQQFQVSDAEGCGTEYALDCGDHCFKAPVNWQTTSPAFCPITSFEFVKDKNTAGVTTNANTGFTKGWLVSTDYRMDLNRLTKAQDPSPESVFLAVEWYGSICVDNTRHPKDPSQNYPLMASSGTDCGTTLGADTVTNQVDSQLEWTFLNDNSKVAGMSDALALAGYKEAIEGQQTFTVGLMNRRRILTRSTTFCDGFRFNNPSQNHANVLLAQFDTIWGLVKWLGIVSTSTACLSGMMVLLVCLDGSAKQTQTFMTVLYTVCLVGLFGSTVLLWKARYLIANNYALPFAHFTKAQSDICITSETWQTVLNTWITNTSFGGLDTQLLYCLILFVVFLVLSVVFAIWALMKLAKHAEQRRRHV